MRHLVCPITINGIKIQAVVDPGATLSLLSPSLTIPDMKSSSLTTQVSGISGVPSSVTLSSPVVVRCGSITTSHAFGLMEIPNNQALLGLDLISKLGITISGIPTQYPVDAQEPISVPVADVIDPLISDKLPEDFRATLIAEITDALEENSRIPMGTLCNHPDALIFLSTKDAQPLFRRQWHIPQTQHHFITTFVIESLANGLIVKAPLSGWNNPIFTVPKKDAAGNITTFRPVLDFRALNSTLSTPDYSLPLIDEIFRALAGSKVFSSCDLTASFNQFPINFTDQVKTSFTWNRQQYMFVGSPFGIKHVSSVVQKVMDDILQDFKDFAKTFVDDVIIHSRNIVEHARHVILVIRRLTAYNLRLKATKCHFGYQTLRLLGHQISTDGISIDVSKLHNLRTFPTPTSVKQVQSLLGTLNYLRNYIPKFATLAAPLEAAKQLPSGSFRWSAECQQSLEKFILILESNILLHHPDYSQPFYVATDASNTGIGAILYQMRNDQRCFIAIQGRALNPAEQKYSANHRELLGIIFALKKFHYFLLGRHFTLYTDHRALTYMHTQNELNSLLSSWSETIFQYDFEVIHCPGILNILPDAISRLFVQERALLLQTSEQSSVAAASRHDILEKAHLAGHFGSTNMSQMIRDQGFNWPNLAADCLKIASSCPSCQKYTIRKKGYHPLQPIHASLPLDHLAIDTAGPLITTSAGNNYFLVVVDVLTRFVWLRPLRDKSAPTIATALTSIFFDFGFPRIFQSDNGSEFRNSLLTSLCTVSKIDKRLVTPYHPRANGLAEKFVHSSSAMVRKLLQGNAEWDLSLPAVQFFLNNKISPTLDTTPFAAMFARRSNQFADYSADTHSPSLPDLHKRLLEMNEILHPALSKKLADSQASKKRKFDQSHALVIFPVGSYVMKIDPTRSTKLQAFYTGPYRIIKSTGNGSYTLMDKDHFVLPRNVATSQLKMISYTPPKIPPSSPFGGDNVV